ncbi:GNAT domain-containing protein [Cyathus striatus]|nr:GNAT domain-containing protein [Cyathus striatus]
MKSNLTTVLIGEKVILVPYRAEHVPKYHTWMLNEDLRTLTASDPLTLDQEYEMQQKWQTDEDKLTFIILAHDSPDGERLSASEHILPTDSRLSKMSMVGDVNLFLKGTPPYAQGHDVKPSPNGHNSDEEEEEEFEAEVEIMIAEPSYRRKGLAQDALHLMLTYATGQPDAFGFSPASPIDSPLNLLPETLVTRISQTNEPSIRLFEKLGFKITKTVEVFQEVEMRWRK